MDYRIYEHEQGSILGFEEAQAVLQAFLQDALSTGPLRDQSDQAFATGVVASVARWERARFMRGSGRGPIVGFQRS